MFIIVLRIIEFQYLPVENKKNCNRRFLQDMKLVYKDDSAKKSQPFMLPG